MPSQKREQYVFLPAFWWLAALKELPTTAHSLGSVSTPSWATLSVAQGSLLADLGFMSGARDWTWVNLQGKHPICCSIAPASLLLWCVTDILYGDCITGKYDTEYYVKRQQLFSRKNNNNNNKTTKHLFPDDLCWVKCQSGPDPKWNSHTWNLMVRETAKWAEKDETFFGLSH